MTVCECVRVCARVCVRWCDQGLRIHGGTLRITRPRCCRGTLTTIPFEQAVTEDAVAVADAAPTAGAAAVLGRGASLHASRPELQHQPEAVPRERGGQWRAGRHVHVRVGVPAERGPPHRHVRRHLHVRIVLRAAAARAAGRPGPGPAERPALRPGPLALRAAQEEAAAALPPRRDHAAPRRQQQQQAPVRVQT